MLGLPTQQEVDDRDVVRREVADDVDVGLVETEVQPGGVDVVELAQRSRVRTMSRSHHDRRVVLERVPSHQRHSGSLGRVDQSRGVAGVGCERLLHEDVLSCRDGPLGQAPVGGRWGGDDDGVDVRESSESDEKVRIDGKPRARAARRYLRVHDGQVLDRAASAQYPHVLRAPVATSDDGDP